MRIEPLLPKNKSDQRIAKRFFYNEELFLLEVYQKLNETGIKMRLFTNYLSTQNLPKTYSMLKRSLPSILSSKCFNNKRLTFNEEVKSTEIGHLFEHILLEYLTKLKKFYEGKHISFSGVTSWDWTKGEHGVFNITVSIGAGDAKIFEEALIKSIQLLNRIINRNLPKIN